MTGLAFEVIVESFLGDDQKRLLEDWKNRLNIPKDKYLLDAVSYRYKWVIVPTSAGDEITVIDLMTNESLDLSMAETW